MDFSPGTGLERIGYQVLLALHASLNAELGVQASNWAQLDSDMASELRKPYVPVQLEEIGNQNFYLGHRPSLMQASIESYPNVSVMMPQARPAPDQGDQWDTYQDSIVIETLVKSIDVDDGLAEMICNARIQRTASAILSVLGRNKTLDGTVMPMQTPPSVTISNVFVRNEAEGHGQRWLWQGARIELAYERHSKIY